MMKFVSKHRSLSILALLATVSCSKADDSDRNEDTTNYEVAENSITSDAELTAEANSLAINDALESLADSNEGTSGATSLALRDVTRSVESDDSFTKTCKVDGDGAVVKVVGTIDRSVNIEGARFSRVRAVKGESTVTRTFSKTDGSVDCVVGKRANIDWLGDLTGYSLDVSIARTGSADVELKNTVKNTSTTLARSFKVDGKRSVEWTTHSTDADAGTFTRSKTITTELARLHTRLNSDGAERELNFTVKTSEDKPLTVDVVRKSADGSLVSKTIKSGTIEAVREGDGKVVTTYSDLKFDFAASGCSYSSGSAAIAIYKSGESDAASNFTFKVGDNGSYTLTNDKTGAAVSDFDVEECALADFK